MLGDQSLQVLNEIRSYLSNLSSSELDESSIHDSFREFRDRFFLFEGQGDSNCIILKTFLHDRKRCVECIKPLFGDILAEEPIGGLLDRVLGGGYLRQAIMLRAAHTLLLDRIEKGSTDRIAEQLRILLRGYSENFSTGVWEDVFNLFGSDVGRCDSSGLDFWLEGIKGVDGPKVLVDAFSKIANSGDASQAMINPSFLFLLHSTIVLLSRDRSIASGPEGDWDIGTAWGVTAVEDSAIIKKMGIYGFVFKLRVRESLIGGSAPQCLGIPYPCPVNGAYLRFDEDFQRGVMNAWLLNRKFERNCGNVVYSLDPFCEPNFVVVARSSRLVGDSMAAAFGIALRSTDLRQRLRDDAVCSCSINFDGTYNYASEKLSPVGSIARKMSVIDIFDQMKIDHRRQIKVFYVSQNEDPFGLPDNVELRGDISHFSDLYDRMTLNEKLIEEFCQNKSERWTRIGGRDPYQE